jgi:hypothetical protein
MKILDALIEIYPDEELLIADGFDEAILGIEENTMRVIYSVSKCLEIIEAEGMPEQEALEHFYFNVQGSYVGEKTPIFCFDEFKNIVQNG